MKNIIYDCYGEPIHLIGVGFISSRHASKHGGLISTDAVAFKEIYPVLEYEENSFCLKQPPAGSKSSILK